MSIANFDNLPSSVMHGGVRYRTDGRRMLKDIGSAAYNWGVPVPPVLHTAREGDAENGNMEPGTYALHLVGRNRWGKIGNPHPFGPVNVTVTAADNTGSIVIENIPLFTDPQVDYVQIYATYPQSDDQPPAPPFLLAATAPAGSASIVLTAHHANWPTTEMLEPPELFADIESHFGGPFRYAMPPVKRRVAFWDGRVWMAGETPVVGGQVTAVDNSPEMTGVEMPVMDGSVVGRWITLEGENAGYRIESIQSDTEWTLDRPYRRPSWRDADPDGVSATITGKASEVLFSETTEPEYVPPTNSFLVGGDDGGVVTGLYPVGDEMLVTTDRAVYAVRRTGQASLPYDLRKTFSAAGCAAARSGVVARGGFYFFSGNGFHALRNNTAVNIGAPLGDWPDRMTPAFKPHVVGVALDNRIYWAVSRADPEWLDTILVYDLDTGTWDFPWTGFQLYDFGMLTLATTGEKRLVTTQPAGDGFIMSFFRDGWLHDGTNNQHLHGTATGGDDFTLHDGAAEFPDGNAGLRGALLRIVRGNGVGDERFIVENTRKTLTVEPKFSAPPDTTTEYEVGVVKARYRTGRLHFDEPHDEKKFTLLETGFGKVLVDE